MKKRFIVLVFSIFLLSSSLVGLWRVPEVSAPGTHAAISIYSNSEFTLANGVAYGSGIEADPYVIEGWIISGPGGDGISIRNTDAFFIIRNCNISTVYSSIFGVEYYTGVYFENVTNGRVENNTLFNNQYPIHLNSFSTGNTLINNTIFNSTTRGIWIDANYPYNDKPSNNNTLIGNTIYNTTGPAIYITYSSYNTLSDNNLFNNTDGIYLSYSSYNTLSGNTINLSGRGIYSDSGSYNNFSNNALVNNTDGIRFASNNAHNIIAGNTVYDSSNWGISIIGSTNTNNTVKNNICRNNTDGIHIEIAHDSILIGNIVANNTIGFNFWQSYNSGITNCSIFGNANWGVYNYGTNPTYVVNASYNWWGSATGPGGAGPGSGDSINTAVYIVYSPWLTLPYPEHEPITITDNSEFTYQNGVVSGSGSEAEPYVIENWAISAASAIGIYIHNTDAFFVIRGCVVSEGSIDGWYGVRLENVTNGRIEGNEFSGTYSGVDLLESDFIVVANNNFSNNDYGISLGSLCANCTLTGNTVSSSLQDGVCIDGSNNNAVTNNTVTDSGEYGILLYASSNNTLTNNTVGNNARDGILIYWDSINNNVTDNYCYNNTETGIDIYVRSSFNAVVGNTVSGNTGIYIYYDSHNNTITSNIVANSSLGIGVSYSHNNTLTSNTILNNSYCGISVDSSSNSTLTDNTIGFNSMGVYIGFSETDNTALLRNTLHNNTQGIYSGGSNVQIAYCLIYNNTDYGVHVESWNPIANATYNWWGSIDGPSGDGYYSGGFGSGDAVSSNVNFIPWLTSPSSEVALHDPIVIENDLQFTEENGVVSGYGTMVDPYVIENWTISSESADGISISNTAAFFILRNCIVEGNANYYYNYGIRFHNVTNGWVKNNTLLCNFYGINLYDSPNNTLSGNIAIDTREQSIFLDSSDNCTLIDNACSDSYMGIYLYYSSNNNLTGNNVSNNYYGIYLEEASFNAITGNIANYNDEGVHITDYSYDNVFIQNAADNNTDYGFLIYDYSHNNIFTNNNASNNYYGIELDYSNNNTITGSTITNNTYGFFVFYSTDTTITGCTIGNNTDYGIWENQQEPVYIVNATHCWWGSPEGPGYVGPGSGDNITANVLYDPWLTSFLNTDPVIDYVHAWGYPGELLDPAGSIGRGGTVRIFTGVSDSETNSNMLTVTIRYRAQTDLDWTNITLTQWEPLYGGYWYYDWIVPGTASLGLYDVTVEVSDAAGGFATVTETGEFNVTNTVPIINYIHAWGYPGELLDPEGAINRGATVRIFTGVWDSETAADQLTVTIGYKAQGDSEWTNITSTQWEPLYGGYWYHDWTIPAGASLGLYDVRVEASDESGGSVSATEYGEFTVANANPVINYVHAWGYPGELLDPEGVISRGGTVRIFTGVSDYETASNLLSVTVKYKAQSDLLWTNITSTLWEPMYGGYWYYDWVVPGTASTGFYDVIVEVSDGVCEAISVTESGEFNVTNAVPVINYVHAWGYPGELLDPAGTINRGSTVRMFTGVWDSETVSNLLSVTIKYKAQSDLLWTNITSTLWEPMYGGYWYYDWTIPGTASMGLYDVMIAVSDGNGGSVSATELGEFTVVDQFTITPTAGICGSISPDTAQTVNYGDTPSFTITADTGYHILDVTVDGTSVLAYMTGDEHSGTYTFDAVDADHDIYATFEIDQFTITPGAGEHGSIYPDNAQTVNYGDTPSFDITADTGYHILDVTVDGNSVLGDLVPEGVSAFGTPAPIESGTYTFSPVDTDHDIYATFAINTYTITVTQSSNGDISPSGTSEVEYGSTPTFMITPYTGYHIESITANGNSVTVTDPAGQTYQFDPVYADGTLTATFAFNET